MLNYKCNKCNISLKTSECPVCGERAELVSSTIYWCSNCKVPVYEDTCPVCGGKAKKIATDLRPVFPEERLLLEILLGEPMKYKEASVWCSSTSVYYADGERVEFKSGEAVRSNNIDTIRQQLEEYRSENTYETFTETIKKWVMANKDRYNYITSEAMDYIRKIADGIDTTSMFVSFSGGKDSTVVSDLVMRALPDKQILHLYGDTTLEFPETMLYVDRFRKSHAKVPVITAKNRTKDFYELCEQIGPPSRVMRPCCTIFKTGAIQRKISALFKNQTRILTFYGIRRNESKSRNKYDRESDGAKILKQHTVSPIIDWIDYDVWLYLLSTGIDFNTAYRLGYTRVGCWCCPNNSSWSEFLSKIYMPEQYGKWHDFLISFAKRIGKPDPEVYVDEGKWKARQGGNGLDYANTTVISYEPCVLQENTLNIALQKPLDNEIYEFFKPFGYINKEIGNLRLGEVYVTGKDGKLKLKLQGNIGDTELKVSILDKNAGHAQNIAAAEDKVRCQLMKRQMCIGCLACESVCKVGAISVEPDNAGMRTYRINDDKCVRCGECISHFDGGCYLRKVVRIQKKKD